MKIKKVTFKQLKDSMLSDEMDIIKARFRDFKELEIWEGNQAIQEVTHVKKQFSQAKTLDDIINLDCFDGFKEEEVLEIIIKHLVKLPK